ncbi:peptidase [Runella rosea]|uniref:Peptidase n=1 Tax=Runella rosea TaxID=2259595 RepID=A0A344TNK3_9BACT|nr:PepSY-associated TM helix domain-containing protein [Runella rosea]AXE20224.1 peptidase [Runella rosea]
METPRSQPQPWTTVRKEATVNTRARASDGNAAWQRRMPTLARWLHLYLSMFSFALVLFFSVTGLTLNHADWFGDASRTSEYKGTLNASWTNVTDTSKVNKLAIVEYLRATHQPKGAMSDFRIDATECSVAFRGPGYTADVFINRSTGAYQVTETKMGLVAVINDLHKGRDTGKTWSLVIDASAIFMTLVSATGLLLLLFLKKRRTSGLLWTLIGLGVCVALYLFLF